MPVGKTLCRIPIELFRVKPVITPEIHKPPVGLQARQAVVGGNPYVSLRVFGYAVDIVVGKTVRRVVVHVCLLAVFHLAPIHSVAVGAHPHCAVVGNGHTGKVSLLHSHSGRPICWDDANN